MNKTTVTRVAMVAAIYAALVWVLAPMSFGVIQFRLAELLKPLALRKKEYVVGLSVGLILANLLSPNAGLWEIALMPFACFIGGYIAWRLRALPVVALTFYGLWVSAAASLMLSLTLALPFAAVLPGIAVSELILFFVGWGVLEPVLRRSASW